MGDVYGFGATAFASKTLQTIEELNQLIDIDGILDLILGDCRRMANADAGTIFLVEGDTLKFSFVHNDTLFRQDVTSKVLYADVTLPIDESSVVGHAAVSRQVVVVDDAYDLGPGLPYTFNKDFDRKTGYRTLSILTVPLTTFRDQLVGVMQVINAKDGQGRTIPFSAAAKEQVPLLAGKAAAAIERGLMTREQILRMMRMAEMRDPSETGAHVQRVGAIAAEIYKRWAMNRALSDLKAKPFASNPEGVFAEVKRAAGLLRLAAMLHDVGKVGIADAILKKPGKLDDGEYGVMKWHSVLGARLFANSTSDLDAMCLDIALHHHERWDGKGYPGDVGDVLGREFAPGASVMGRPLAGEEIPIAARITALSDVYDALCSRRSYKEPWPREKVMELIREESGRQFDPEVVEAFFEIYEVVDAIQRKFRELERKAG
ncbi:MAG: HD domain-containing phosphohydrolase [Thermodesulfobacteriota bacterium]